MTKIIKIDLNKELSESDNDVKIEIIQNSKFQSTSIIGAYMEEIGMPIKTILEYKRT